MNQQVDNGKIDIIPEYALFNTHLKKFDRTVRVPLPIVLQQTVYFRILLYIFKKTLVSPMECLNAPLITHKMTSRTFFELAKVSARKAFISS